jgi:hypothetical protein
VHGPQHICHRRRLLPCRVHLELALRHGVRLPSVRLSAPRSPLGVRVRVCVRACVGGLG